MNVSQKTDVPHFQIYPNIYCMEVVFIHRMSRRADLRLVESANTLQCDDGCFHLNQVRPFYAIKVIYLPFQSSSIMLKYS